jgi:hypothetical protein
MPKKLAFISWSVPNTRSDSLAYHLGIECHYFRYFPSSRFRYLSAPIKYILAAWKTWRLLRRERPERVLVSTPPPFAILVVWIYCRVYGAKFATDTHSAALNLARWKPFLWLTRFLARRAAANIFHSEALARLAFGWDARTVVLGDIPYRLEKSQDYPLKPGFNLVFPCTFAEDEPVEVVVGAARHLREEFATLW